MKEVIVKFEPFIFKQKIFIKDIETGLILQDSVSQSDLANYISLLPNVQTVHCFGNEKYAMKIKRECIIKYKLKNVDILINQ